MSSSDLGETTFVDESEEEEGEDHSSDAYESQLTKNSLFEKSQGLLKAFTMLYTLGFGQEMGLPKIVLLGDQSTGKSSVVESLAGVNLPRGGGIVTRVPTIVSMIQDRSRKILLEGEEIRNCDLSEAFLERQTEIAGGKKDVSSVPIRIDVHAPEVFNLTIIDLPGLVQNQVAGQSETTVAEIRSMVQKEIEQPEAIILAVIPANVDLATVAAIEMAKKVDPDRQRTIGVITKVDCVQDDREVTVSLSQERIELKLGVYAVKNRTPKEVESNLPFEEARRREKAFFAGTSYGREFRGLCGVDQLAAVLAELLRERLARFYPTAQERMEEILSKKRNELEELGPSMPEDLVGRRIHFLSLASRICNEIQTCLTAGSPVLVDGGNVLTCVDEVLHAFGDVLVNKEVDYLSDEFGEKIKTEIALRRAAALPGFPPFEVFRQHTLDTLRRFLPDARRMVASVAAILKESIAKLIERRGEGVGAGRGYLLVLFHRFFTTRQEKATKAIEKRFREEDFVYTHNSGYADLIAKDQIQQGIQLVIENREALNGGGPIDESKIKTRSNEEEEAHRFQVQLDSYHKNAIDRMIDCLPQAVFHRLAVPFHQKFYRYVCGEIRGMSDEEVLRTISEPLQISQKRDRLRREIDKYKKGLEILQTIRM